MNVTLFGATGDLGGECLLQCLEKGHRITLLARSPEKLPAELRSRVTIVTGDALAYEDVALAITSDTDAVLFAIGVDEKTSPPDLCTDITQHIFQAMRASSVSRFIWCGGGSTFQADDVITFGAKFVRWYAETFLKLRHFDKVHQLDLLGDNPDISSIGIRPLQMNWGPRTEKYRLGFNTFNGLSKITFADCAHAMVNMLEDDTWVGKAPIIQY
jgi:putative NADH-flavin reductase